MAAGLVATMTGCSLLAVRGPDENRRPGKAPSCNVSDGSVAADGLFGATSGILAIGLGEDGVLPGLLAVSYIGSAIYGVSRGRRCTAARLAYQDEVDAIQREQIAAKRRARQEAAREDEPELVAPPVLLTPPTPVPTATLTMRADDPFAVDLGAEADGATEGEDEPVADEPADEPTGDVPSPAEQAARWREFWRRLP